jgi:hypothetical protein
MLKNLKKKKSWLYLPILLLLASCSKEDIPSPQPIPPVLKSIFSESYRNQISGIAFTWNYSTIDNPSRTNLNNYERMEYNGGHAYSDVNGDGKEDILVSKINNGIVWYINKGDDTQFISDTTYINTSTFGLSAHKILKTEINKDGKPDFILLGVDERIQGNYSGNFNVLLSTSQKTFNLLTIPNPNKYWFHNGACGDLNNDGNVDVITATFVWYGDGTGNFTKSNVELNKYTQAILVYEILDMDGDGKDDIIVGGNDEYGNTMIIYNNQTLIGATTTQFPKNSQFPFCVDIEFLDVNGDGVLDIVELRGDKSQIQTKIFTYIKTSSGYSLDLSFFDDSIDGGGVIGQSDKYGWSSFKVDDMDKDGIVDLVAENYHDSKWNGYKKIGGKWVKTIFY